MAGRQALSHQYPTLFNIAREKQVSVATILSSNPMNISFRRNLSPDKWELWLQLVQRLMEVNLNEEQDTFVWSLTQSGTFSVKSMYLDLLNDDTRYL